MMINVSCYKNYRATGIINTALVHLLVKWNGSLEETLEPEMNNINQGDRMMNDDYGMDFAWSSGILVSRPGPNNTNLKIVQHSSYQRSFVGGIEFRP